MADVVERIKDNDRADQGRDHRHEDRQRVGPERQDGHYLSGHRPGDQQQGKDQGDKYQDQCQDVPGRFQKASEERQEERSDDRDKNYC